METSSSLFACDRVKTRASGAFNFRSFSGSTMHFQHRCSVEAYGAPTQKKLPIMGDLQQRLQCVNPKPLEKIFKQRGLSCSF